MTDLIHVPFDEGLSDSGDPVMIGGKLYQATNVRFRKQGRAAKRYGYLSETYSGLTGLPNALGEYRNVGFVASDYQLITNAGIVGNTVNATIPGRMSRVLPNRVDPIFTDPTRGACACRCDMTTTTLGSYYVYVWDQGSEFGYSVRTQSDNLLVFQQERIAGSMVRAILADKSYLVHRSGTSLKYYSVSGTTFALSAATTLGTLNATSSVYDACPGLIGTDFYAVYQSSATVLTVIRVVNGSITATATPTVNTVCGGVSICVGSFGVYVAYVRADKSVYSLAYDSALTTLTGPTVLDDNPVDTYYGQPGVVAYSATQVLVVVNGKNTLPGTNSRYCRSARVTVSTLLPDYALTKFWHVSLASHPFFNGSQSQDLQRVYCWFCTDNDLPAFSGTTLNTAGWTNQRTYWMLDLLDESNLATHTPSLVMNATPLVGFTNEAAGSPLMLPRVQGQLGGAHPCVVPLLDVIQPRPALANTGLNSDLTMVKAVSWLDGNDGNITPTSARRDFVQIDDAVHFAGGFVSEYMGALTESGFMHYPVIIGATYTSGGGGIAAASGMYSYAACYEWIDPQGRRHRSQPSDPLNVPIGPTLQARVYVSTLLGGKSVENPSFDTGGVVIALYRTTSGGSTYYKVSPHLTNGQTAAPTESTPVVALDDPFTDATLVTHEILYTMGGVLGNIVPPAAKYLATGGGRVWLAGMLENRRVALSKIIVRGEPVQFPDDDTFRIDLPEDITGIKWGDGTLIVFSKHSIYLVTGEGPNDQGVGSFSTPQRLPSNVGCIEHFSIVEMQNGWIFQSVRGFYLLPRGFGPPVYIGADIQEGIDATAQIYTSALVQTSGETTVRYMVNLSNTVTVPMQVLVWDCDSQKWVSRDDPVSRAGSAPPIIGIHGGAPAFALADNSVMQESTGSFAGQSGAFIETHLRTGNLRPFGMLGFGRVEKLQVYGEIRGNALLNVRTIMDGSDTQTFSSIGKTGLAGAKFSHQLTLPNQQCNTIDVEVWDSAPTSTPTGPSEGLVFHGLTLEVDTYDGLPRLGAGDKS